MCERHPGLRPSLLFITGDVVYGASKGADTSTAAAELRTQWRSAKQWLDSILAAPQMADVTPMRVFVVPGNHDVSHAHVTGACESVVRTLCGLPLGAGGSAMPANPLSVPQVYRDAVDVFSTKGHPQVASYLAHLDEYRNGIVACGLAHCAQDSRLIYRHIVRCGLDDVEIFGLNTAWGALPSLRGYTALPMLADWQVGALQNEGPKPERAAALKIVLMHHPASWALPAERPALYANLVNVSDFVLRGHEHSTWVSPWGATSVEISAAAVMQPHVGAETPGYNIVEVDLDTRVARVFFRRFNSKMRDFEASTMGDLTTSDGAWVVEIGQPPDAPKLESAHAMRRSGYLHDGFVRLADIEGAVLTFDILRFSALAPEDQQLAVAKLWSVVSQATLRLDEHITRVVMSPLSDGVQIGIAGDSESRTLRAACMVAEAVLGKSSREQFPGNAMIRAGLDRGQFSVIATKRRSPTILLGSTANRSRKWAYLCDPWTMGCSEDLWTGYLRDDPGRFGITESAVTPRRDQSPMILLAPSIRPLRMRIIGFGHESIGPEVKRVATAWGTIDEFFHRLRQFLKDDCGVEVTPRFAVPVLDGTEVVWTSVTAGSRDVESASAGVLAACNGLRTSAFSASQPPTNAQQVEAKPPPGPGGAVAVFPCYVYGPPQDLPIVVFVEFHGLEAKLGADFQGRLADAMERANLPGLHSAFEHLYHVRA